jgi:hypothetical protein
MKHWWNDTDRRKQILGQKSVPVPLCSPQITHNLKQNQNWSTAVTLDYAPAQQNSQKKPIYILCQCSPTTERASLFEAFQTSHVCSSGDSNMYMEKSVQTQRNDSVRGNRSTRRKSCPNETLSIANLKRCGPESKNNIRAERPTIALSHGTA